MTARHCNHDGPRFAELKEQHPEAVAFHWFQNAFNPSDCYWLVAYPIACGGGPGKEWRKVQPDSL